MTSAPARAAAMLASLLVLAACGGGTSDTSDSPSTSSPPSARASAGAARGPVNDTDIMFATGMIPHHAQAVEMSDLVLAKPGLDPDVRELAKDIRAAQAPEIELMRGWLAGWDQPVPPADGTGPETTGPMPGMDHGPGGMSTMSGADMAALEDASGSRASVLFLEQMVVHHRGAIDMARMEIAAGENPDARDLAREIVRTQEAEITTMTELLAAGTS
jgi:uncharacterized protein (DUF305 family)